MAEASHDVAAAERSIQAVRAIRQVLHAIWALSRAQMPLVEAAASAAAVYQQWVDDAVERIAGAPRRAPGTRVLHVVFGPERPFSGALARRIADAIPSEGDIGLVGWRLAETVAQSPEIDGRVRFRCAGSVAHDDLDEVALTVAGHILAHGRAANVVVIHPVDGASAMASAPLVGARLPVDQPPETFGSLGLVVEAAVREAMTGRLAVAAVEALRAEVRARMVAADAARHACDERLAELESLWHSRRRETITRELLEAVAGREATRPVGP